MIVPPDPLCLMALQCCTSDKNKLPALGNSLCVLHKTHPDCIISW